MSAARFWPLESGRIITSPFGPRGGGFHAGVDFGWPGGSGGKPVYAIQAGTVIFAGAAQGYGGPDPAGWLVIRSAPEQGGGCLEFGHIIREVAVGDRVQAGQRIARINPSSATNGGVAPHLHLSDMPYGYNPAAKQDPMPRLLGAREPGQETPMTTGPWTGDPIWLADVLRAELGDRLVVHPGWERRGNGVGVNGTNQMGTIWGVMIHHTGSMTTTPEFIISGRHDLPGPLYQGLVTPDGKLHLTAVGPCNHAGRGSYPGVPANQGNQLLIGLAGCWPTIRADGSHDAAERWIDAVIVTLRDATAAILRRLGHGPERAIGHKDYSSTGSWDPGNFSMPWFRGEVGKAIRGEFNGTTPVEPEPPTPGGFLMALNDEQQQHLLDATIEARDNTRWLKDQLGPGFDAWGEDGDLGRNAKGQRLTLRAGLAALIRKVGA